MCRNSCWLLNNMRMLIFSSWLGLGTSIVTCVKDGACWLISQRLWKKNCFLTVSLFQTLAEVLLAIRGDFTWIRRELQRDVSEPILMSDSSERGNFFPRGWVIWILTFPFILFPAWLRSWLRGINIFNFIEMHYKPELPKIKQSIYKVCSSSIVRLIKLLLTNTITYME